MGKRILNETHDRSGRTAGDLIAARHCEENDHEQREIQDREVSEDPRQRELQKKSEERNANSRAPMKAVDLNALASDRAGHLARSVLCGVGGRLQSRWLGWTLGPGKRGGLGQFWARRSGRCRLDTGCGVDSDMGAFTCIPA